MSINTDSTACYSKNPAFSTTLLPDGKWMFYDSASNEVVITSPTAGILWELCGEGNKLKGVLEALSKIYPEQGEALIRKDIESVVPELVKHNLLLCDKDPQQIGIN